MGDFGISVETKDSMMQASTCIGTWNYMAPEMLSKSTEQLGTHSDIYMLGAILYEILTGDPPHPRTGEMQQRIQHVRENQIDVPEDYPLLGRIAIKAMATNPNERFQSVRDLSMALAAYNHHLSLIHI